MVLKFHSGGGSGAGDGNDQRKTPKRHLGGKGRVVKDGEALVY